MSIATVTAFLLLSGAQPLPAVVAAESPAAIETQPVETQPVETQSAEGEPAPPVVVPTIGTMASPPSPSLPSSSPPSSSPTSDAPVPLPAPPSGEQPDDLPPSPDDIVVTARGEAPPGDPMQEVNAASYRAVQSVDRALVEPVATGYQGIVPEPVRDGLGNALRNLTEPVNFLNYLLQFKIGKAAETLGRFVVNTTFGVGGLFDVAKTDPFNLPYRQNGFANTLGFYGVEPGPYFYLPLVGSTTLRDMVGDSIDLLVLPTSIGAPFNRTAYAVPTTVIKQLNDRIDNDAEIQRLEEESNDPYVETRTLYLEMRQREIDALRGKGHDVVAGPHTEIRVGQAEPAPSADSAAPVAGETAEAEMPAIDSSPLLPVNDRASPEPENHF